MKNIAAIIVLSLLSSYSLADGTPGNFRIAGAECGVKGNKHFNSVWISIDGDSARVFVYDGPRNPIKTTQGLAASGVGTAYSMIGFPRANAETVVIKLDPAVAAFVKLPYLTLSYKTNLSNPELPTPGYFSNPMSEDDDIALNCYMNSVSTDENMNVINTNYVQRAQHPSLCQIEFKDGARTPEWTHGCTATVIGEKTLISAAHCEESFGHLRETRVRCGESTEYIRIAKWISNPAYRPSNHPISNADDISVLVLESSPQAPVVEIETQDSEVKRMLLENRNCRHYGFGQRQDGSMGKLYTAAYAFPAAELGGKAFVERIFDMSNMIISDPVRFLRNGDSGGPIICQNARGQDVIVGIHSYISVASFSARSSMTSKGADFVKAQIK